MLQGYQKYGGVEKRYRSDWANQLGRSADHAINTTDKGQHIYVH